MLRLLPNLPLAQSDATITYANLVAQTAATGVKPTTATAPDDEQRAWVAAMLHLHPPATAQHWLQEEWVEAVGGTRFSTMSSIRSRICRANCGWVRT